MVAGAVYSRMPNRCLQLIAVKLLAIHGAISIDFLIFSKRKLLFHICAGGPLCCQLRVRNPAGLTSPDEWIVENNSNARSLQYCFHSKPLEVAKQVKVCLIFVSR